VSLILCYGSIIASVRRQARITASQRANNPVMTAADVQAMRIQMNAVKTIIRVSVAFFICFLLSTLLYL
jgi:hypothetical protein